MATVTHILMPGIFPDTLARDGVASSEELLSLRKDRGGLCSRLDFARVTRTPRPGSLRLRMDPGQQASREAVVHHCAGRQCCLHTGTRTTCLIRQHGYVTALLGDGILHRPVVDRVELFARGPDD